MSIELIYGTIYDSAGAPLENATVYATPLYDYIASEDALTLSSTTSTRVGVGANFEVEVSTSPTEPTPYVVTVRDTRITNGSWRGVVNVYPDIGANIVSAFPLDEDADLSAINQKLREHIVAIESVITQSKFQANESKRHATAAAASAEMAREYSESAADDSTAAAESAAQSKAARDSIVGTVATVSAVERRIVDMENDYQGYLDDTRSAANTANLAASSAEASAMGANIAKTDAETAATSAAASSSSAGADRVAASDAATAAAASASNALASRNAAGSSASAALTSRTGAATSATTATTKASEAAASASAAETSASQAANATSLSIRGRAYNNLNGNAPFTLGTSMAYIPFPTSQSSEQIGSGGTSAVANGFRVDKAGTVKLQFTGQQRAAGQVELQFRRNGTPIGPKFVSTGQTWDSVSAELMMSVNANDTFTVTALGPASVQLDGVCRFEVVNWT